MHKKIHIPLFINDMHTLFFQCCAYSLTFIFLSMSDYSKINVLSRYIWNSQDDPTTNHYKKTSTFPLQQYNCYPSHKIWLLCYQCSWNFQHHNLYNFDNIFSVCMYILLLPSFIFLNIRERKSGSLLICS